MPINFPQFCVETEQWLQSHLASSPSPGDQITHIQAKRSLSVPKLIKNTQNFRRKGTVKICKPLVSGSGDLGVAPSVLSGTHSIAPIQSETGQIIVAKFGQHSWGTLPGGLPDCNFREELLIAVGGPLVRRGM